MKHWEAERERRMIERAMQTHPMVEYLVNLRISLRAAELERERVANAERLAREERNG